LRSSPPGWAACSATDTVVALDANGNGSPDYFMTVKGPIAAPEVSTRGR
jgi:hypothetical protein